MSRIAHHARPPAPHARGAGDRPRRRPASPWPPAPTSPPPRRTRPTPSRPARSTISNSHGDAAILSAADLRPGDPPVAGHRRHRELRLAVGRVHARPAARPTTPTPTTRCRRKLSLVVRDCGAFAGATAPACGAGDGDVVYDGTLAGMTGAEALGDVRRRREAPLPLRGRAGRARPATPTRATRRRSRSPGTRPSRSRGAVRRLRQDGDRPCCSPSACCSGSGWSCRRCSATSAT